MATMQRGYTFGATEQVTAAKLHLLVDNGQVDDIVAADITDGSITDAKISSISGSKFIQLNLIPPGAGVIPAANLPAIPGSSINSVIDHQYITGFTMAGEEKGDVLYFDGTDWVVLHHGTDGQVLRSQGHGANPTWTTVTTGTLPITPSGISVSNVVYSWGGGGDASVTAAEYGIVTDTTKNGTVGQLYAVNRNTNSHVERTVLRSKFMKIAGISTLTVYADIIKAGAFNTHGNCKITVGALTALDLETTAGTLEWLNGTIDVSTLSDGTVYDLGISLVNHSTTGSTELHSIIIFGG
jgi:hypothetical protein